MKTRHNFLTVCFLLVTALGLACGDDSPSEPPGGRLTLAAKVAPSSVSAGEPLEVTLTAENRGSERVELQLGGCRSSFLITRGGVVVFDLKDTLACPAVVTSLVLEPGESASFRHLWQPSDQEPPGQYEARKSVV